MNLIRLLSSIDSFFALVKNKLTPKYIERITDPERASISKFIEEVAQLIEPGAKVLDAGAGRCPYKSYFSHAVYESTDFSATVEAGAMDLHTFECDLHNIPREVATYDAVICTQVLEHVEYPQKVVQELSRVLKPGGILALTAPQQWKVHGEPYHYFNFTKYGLASLFKNAGLTVKYISPRGGVFWYISKVLKSLHYYILYQYMFQEQAGKKTFAPSAAAIILIPLYLVAIPLFEYIIPIGFYYLDAIDKKQAHTLGYACCCIKDFPSNA